MYGNLLLVYADENLKNRISNVEHDSIKCGLGNKVGNTGCVSIKMMIDDTKLCFVGCQLPSGRDP